VEILQIILQKKIILAAYLKKINIRFLPRIYKFNVLNNRNIILVKINLVYLKTKSAFIKINV